MIYMRSSHAGVGLALGATMLLAGCATGGVGDRQSVTPVPTHFVACYAYGCRIEKKFPITKPVADRFAAIMASASASPAAERAAISSAVQYYEELSAKAIGARDEAKSPVMASGAPGQMDCIDESTNTRHLMQYLEARGFMVHHSIEQNVTRGALLDGRYPHWTAVIKERGSGTKWAVDSWYEPAGGAPDIMPLAEWRKRGVWGER